MLTMSVLDGTFAICRLRNEEGVPPWAVNSGFFSVTRTMDELSVVCPQENVPEGICCEKEWRCLKVEGPLDFSLTGILSSLALPLARSGISIFALSTYDTDYLLVKENQLQRAIFVLSREACQFI